MEQAPEYDQYWAQDYESTHNFIQQTALDELREFMAKGNDSGEIGYWGEQAASVFFEHVSTGTPLNVIAESRGFDTLCPEQMAIIAAAQNFLNEYYC